MRMPIPFFISLGMFVIMTFLSLGLWSALPAASASLFALPAAMLLATAIFFIVPMINPNALNHQGRYALIWLAVIFALTIGHGLIIRQALFALAAAHPA
ncbi:hypothetical protein [Neorhizobium sp. NCHU2750]|uniref:hypothetical protein n=1 Tax=Neorhizobium sp. NCHU2750 TaxID=1825976 RepID=UPI000E75F195|nr:hypothetical protein NCHU2750_27350 [Neorhizobium sp. NCHU2750]